MSLAAVKISRSLMISPRAVSSPLSARHRPGPRNRFQKKSWAGASDVVAEGVDQPGPGVSPVAVGGSGRDAQGRRGLGDGQAGEVAELDDLGGAGVEGGELFEGLVEGEQSLRVVLVRRLVGGQVVALE